jgi:hypothetical protein
LYKNTVIHHLLAQGKGIQSSFPAEVTLKKIEEIEPEPEIREHSPQKPAQNNFLH